MELGARGPDLHGHRQDRLPDAAGTSLLKPMDTADAYYGDKATGMIKDSTPPPTPYNLSGAYANGTVALKWDADADLETGIKTFTVFRHGAARKARQGRLPGRPHGAVRRYLRNISGPRIYLVRSRIRPVNRCSSPSPTVPARESPETPDPRNRPIPFGAQASPETHPGYIQNDWERIA